MRRKCTAAKAAEQWLCLHGSCTAGPSVPVPLAYPCLRRNVIRHCHEAAGTCWAAAACSLPVRGSLQGQWGCALHLLRMCQQLCKGGAGSTHLESRLYPLNMPGVPRKLYSSMASEEVPAKQPSGVPMCCTAADPLDLVLDPLCYISLGDCVS